MSAKEIQKLISHFKLQSHPEGGYYARTYASTINIKSLQEDRYKGATRPAATAIHYLLGDNDFSAFHKLKSDEVWFYHKGTSVKIHVINQEGEIHSYILGDTLNNPEAQYQVQIQADNWFAAELIDKTSYCLVSCMVAPGFEFIDFKLADRSALIKEYPQHSSIIEAYTRVTENSA